MKLAYVGAAPKSVEEVARRRSLLQQWTAPDTTLDMVYAA